MREKIKNLFKKIKDLFTDNYKVLSFITVFYFCLCFISQLIWDDFPFCTSWRDTGEIVFYWLILIYSIWTVVKLFKEDSKSSWILFFIFLGLFYNPIKRLNFRHDEMQGIIFIFSLLLIMIFNKELFNHFKNFFKSLFEKFIIFCYKIAHFFIGDEENKQ